MNEIIVQTTCEYCGEAHGRADLCQRVTRRGMSRRSFLFLGGAAAVGLALAPGSQLLAPTSEIVTPYTVVKGSPFYRMLQAATNAPPERMYAVVHEVERALRQEGEVLPRGVANPDEPWYPPTHAPGILLRGERIRKEYAPTP